MASTRQIIIFGDLTNAFEDDLKRLLHIRDDANLRDFFSRVAYSLRREFALLPQTRQEWLPRFTTLHDLLENNRGLAGAPALRFTLLCVYEIGAFIQVLANTTATYPSAADTYILGLCTGCFSAAAVSSSRTVQGLVHHGVEAVILAFHTALYSLETKYSLAATSSSEPQLWSTIVSLSEAEATALVEQYFSSRTGKPTISKPYISAVGLHNVTISGPPDGLAEFTTSNHLKQHALSIESPYHASHIFTSDDVEQLLTKLNIDSSVQTVPILSPVTGALVEGRTYRETLRQAVHDTLCEQIRWDKITSGCINLISSGKNVEECTIMPISSNAAPTLSSALSSGTQAKVTLKAPVFWETEKTANPASTGQFGDSKIAIIGYSGRFPEADSNEKFWELLMQGRDTHRTIPSDRFDWEAHYDPTGKRQNTSKVKYGCFINEPGLFDARFFHLSPKEAEDTDPAQRLALMATFEALEMAGFVPDRTPSTQRDRVGVFFGVTSDDWREVNSGQDVGTYFIPGGNRAFVPGRISYFFRFAGPSISVDTACSSSFAALNTACINLWEGNCDTAIAGGTNVLTNPDNFAGLDRGHFLSTTGNCNPFDNDASGYCRADGVGSVILKRLEDAIADKDPIFGVIAGVHTNHCGQTVSITRPHEGDQLSLFKRIMRHSGTNPVDVSYIEMHGTGTQAGDAAEMNSVLTAFEKGYGRTTHQPLYLGAVKANIGHSESASGVSALIKVLMMMQHDTIPPHIGIKNKINVNYPLDLDERHVKICLKATPWRRSQYQGGKRISFLNNFSAAGGNTAVLLEDAPLVQQDDEDKDGRSIHPVAVTARSMRSLKENLAAIVGFLESRPDTALPALSYTTTARRIHNQFRLLVTGSTTAGVKSALEKKLESVDKISAIPPAKNLPKIVVTFTGQGALYVSMGRELFETVDTFRSNILHYDSIAQKQGFQSFLPLITSNTDELDLETIDVVTTHLALICVQMALYRLWRSWGIAPSYVIGHSLGEYAAFFASGVLTASDTIHLGGTRAQLLSVHCTKNSHSMVAVKAPLSSVKGAVDKSNCDIACVNSPTDTVVSGPMADIDNITKELRTSGLECVKLSIPYAFHSTQVEPFLEQFRAIAEGVEFHNPNIPYISPFLAKVVTNGGELTSSYLVGACRATVNFQGAVEAASSAGLINGKTHWLEIGVHPTNSSFIKKIMGQAITLASLRQGADPWKTITASLEILYLNGHEIQWNEYHRPFGLAQRVVPLPKYKWDLKNYWIMYKNNFCLTKGSESKPAETVSTDHRTRQSTPPFISSSVHRIIQEKNEGDFSTLLVESDIHDRRLLPLLKGHMVNGVALTSSSIYADMVLTMAKYMIQSKGTWTENVGLDCRDMKVQRPLPMLPLSTSQPVRVQATANWARKQISFSIWSVDSSERKLADHASCVVEITPNHAWMEEWQRNSYLIQSRISSLESNVNKGNTHKIKRGLVYKLFGALVDYADRYQGMQEVVLDSELLEATARVVFQCDDEGFEQNPCWTDSLGSIAGFIMNGNDNVTSKDQVFINHGWSRMRCTKKLEVGKTYQTHNRMQLQSGTMYAGDTYVLEDGVVIAVFEGVKFQGVPRAVLDNLLPSEGGKRGRASEAPSKTIKLPAKASIQATRASPTPHEGTQRVVPNENPAMLRLKEIISEESGVDIADLKPDTEFTEIGIDSLLSLTISSRLQEELGLNISSASFIEYQSLGEMLSSLPSHAGAMVSSTSDIPLSSDSDNDGDETDATSVDDDVASEIADARKIVQLIRAAIAEEAGVPLEDITNMTRLSELGVDSLLSLTITSRLEELGLRLAPGLLAENDTLQEIQNSLLPSIASRDKGSRPLIVKPSASVSDPPFATSVRLSRPPERTSIRRNLFLFPDGAGSATSYTRLPSFSSTVVYGLNCPWLRNPQDLRCSLEHYVSKFLAEIRKRQPSGPYYFGGWSAGGILAYEAAQQLSREGEEVAQLLLLDSPDPVGLENPPQRLYDFLESMDMFGSNRSKAPSWLRPHFDSFLKVLDDYKVRKFEGKSPKAHIFYARDGMCKNPEDPRPNMYDDDPREMHWLINNRTDFSGGGWRDLVGEDNLSVTVLDNVNHYTITDGSLGLGAAMEKVLAPN